jgi:hypothetical protein
MRWLDRPLLVVVFAQPPAAARTTGFLFYVTLNSMLEEDAYYGVD